MKTILLLTLALTAVACSSASENPSDVPNDATGENTCTLSKPAPMAYACTTDAECSGHRCNVAAGKCAWPCVTDCDCNPGFYCAAPACTAY